MPENYHHTDSKLAFIICANGLGHYKRSLSIINLLARRAPGLEIHIWCQPWQRDRLGMFKNLWQSLHWHFDALDPGVRWHNDPNEYKDGRLFYWAEKLKAEHDIQTADFVISDNMAGILDIRPDAMLLGSFLWSDVLEPFSSINSEVQRFVSFERNLLAKYLPEMICIKDITMPGVLKQTRPVKVGWMCDNSPSKPTEEVHGPGIALLTGATATLDMWLEKAIDELLRKHGRVLYLPEAAKQMIPVSKWTQVHSFDFSPSAYSKCALVICRPGIGEVTACIATNTPMAYVYEPDNLEMTHNAERLQELGLGHDLGGLPRGRDFTGPVEIIFDSDRLLQMSRRLETVDKNGLKQAATWILQTIKSR